MENAMEKRPLLKQLWKDLKATADSFSDDHATTHAAALAYYTVFAAAPLLLIAISVGGLFFGNEASSGEIYSSVRGLLGPEGARALQAMVEAAAVKGQSILASAIGIATLLIGATTVFGQLQESLNQIWKVQPKPGATVRTLLRQRLLSFSMIIVIAFLLLVSLIAGAVLSGFEKFATTSLPGGKAVWELLNIGLSFGITALLFGAIYKILPDVELEWRDVRTGGLITAFFFTIGKYLIGLYLGQSAITSSYGAAGAAVLILVWTYYASTVLLFGAEYTRIMDAGSKGRLKIKTGRGMDPARGDGDDDRDGAWTSRA